LKSFCSFKGWNFEINMISHFILYLSSSPVSIMLLAELRNLKSFLDHFHLFFNFYDNVWDKIPAFSRFRPYNASKGDIPILAWKLLL
jgi:hypothetical protein